MERPIPYNLQQSADKAGLTIRDASLYHGFKGVQQRFELLHGDTVVSFGTHAKVQEYLAGWHDRKRFGSL